MNDFDKGHRLLRQLLPWARAEAAKLDETQLVEESALGAATFAHVSEDNLDALLIRPAPKGGWHADLLLRRVPPGVPNTLGTPVANPCPTRAEAEEYGKRILVSVLCLARANAAKAAPPVFLLHGWVFPLLPSALTMASRLVPGFEGGYGSPLQAAGRIAAKLDQLCPEGFEATAFNAWPRDKQIDLAIVLHRAALSGLFAYPMRQDQAPEP